MRIDASHAIGGYAAVMAWRRCGLGARRWRRQRRSSRRSTSSRSTCANPFSAVVADASALPARSALIDGEVVVIDEDGRTNFQALQAAIKGAPRRLEFYAFDLLNLDGEDLTNLPLIDRKTKLATLLEGHSGVIHYSDHIVGQGEALFDKFCGAGLEGVISKRADARCVGSRAGGWLKTKCTRRQEFVVVGWTTSDKGRGFRSLILGVNEGGKLLRWQGRHRLRQCRDQAARQDPGAVGRRGADGRSAPFRGAGRALDKAQARGGDRLHRDDDRGDASSPQLPGSARGRCRTSR